LLLRQSSPNLIKENRGDSPPLNARVAEVEDKHQPQPTPNMLPPTSPLLKPKLQPSYSPKPARRKPRTVIVSEDSPSPSPEPITPDPSGCARHGIASRGRWLKSR
jgi:hypothetical protein